MLHQLAADLQQYEAKTSRFFRSLLPGSRPTELARQRTLTPTNEDEDEALHTEQEHDEDPTDSDLYSDDSQNLHGFESTIEGDHGVVNSEDDGEAVSSASSSGVFRAYTDRRMAAILNAKGGVTSSFGGATTDGVMPSSEGEGTAGAAARVRSRSIESRHLSTKGGAGKAHRRSLSIGSSGGPIAAREQQRITNLENALQSALPKTPTGAAFGSPRSQQPKAAAAAASAPLSTASLHYASLDRRRLAAVLRVAKDDQPRAVRLAQSYSQLLDRLGLGQTGIDDMKDFASSGAVKVFVPAKHSSASSAPLPTQTPLATTSEHATSSAIVRHTQQITKDGSRLLSIEVRKLPLVPSNGGPTLKKQYATNLIRYLLYVLEELRFDAADGSLAPVGTDGGELQSAFKGQSAAEAPAASSEPVSSASRQVTASVDAGVPAAKTKTKSKTKKMLGGNATRRSGAASSSHEDSFTVLVDVGGCDSSALSALTVVLSEGEELLCQAYPLSIVRVVVHQGLTLMAAAQQPPPDPPATAVEPARSTTESNDKQQAQKKAPALSVFTSLFKPKASKNVTDGPKAAATTTGPTPSFASKVWLSVSFSTWKLRFLHHTVRSRTVLADKLEPFVSVEAMLNAVAAAQ